MSPTAPIFKKRVVIMISGTGSNMDALIAACKASEFPAEVVGVLSDKASAGGLEKASAQNIEAHAYERSNYASKIEHENAIIEKLEKIRPDFICLAGYMRLLSAEFVRRWNGRIINIHPSLLPNFPGLDTHQRVLEAGMRLHGASVHFVTEGMDEGPVIAQAALSVNINDTPQSLAERILIAEHQLYPHALGLVAGGAVRMSGVGSAEFSKQNAITNDEILFSPGLKKLKF